MRLVEPNEETYALWINEETFSIFVLFYTDLGYKTISGQELKRFKNHYGYFIVDKKEKTIGFIETTIFTMYQDKEYNLMELIENN